MIRTDNETICMWHKLYIFLKNKVPKVVYQYSFVVEWTKQVPTYGLLQCLVS